MRIDHVVEKPDGTVRFQGTLEGPELAFVIEYGLNLLLMEGAIPFVAKETHNPASVLVEASTTEQ